jgi:sugar lactone lactonase YvrE
MHVALRRIALAVGFVVTAFPVIAEGATPVFVVAGANERGIRALGATAQPLVRPEGLAAASDGSLLIADAGGNAVWRLSPTGTAVRVAGDGRAGFSGDGGRAVDARLNGPSAVLAVGESMVIADSGNDRLRVVDPQGRIHTLAGSGVRGFAGDGGPAPQANLNLNIAASMVMAPDGRLIFPDSGNNRIRAIDSSGTITTIAGNGDYGFGGDGGPATDASFRGPSGVALAGDGTLLVVDHGNSSIRGISPTGGISTLAGGAPNIDVGTRCCFGGDGGPAIGAGLNLPWGIAADRFGGYLIADTYNRAIRHVDAVGTITTSVSSIGGIGPVGVASSQGETFFSAGSAVYLAQTAGTNWRAARLVSRTWARRSLSVSIASTRRFRARVTLFRTARAVARRTNVTLRRGTTRITLPVGRRARGKYVLEVRGAAPAGYRLRVTV